MRYLIAVLVLVASGAMVEAKGPIRERIAERRAARQQCQPCQQPAFPAVSRIPVVQAAGQLARDAVNIIPAAYYSLPFTNCPNGQCPRR